MPSVAIATLGSVRIASVYRFGSDTDRPLLVEIR
ncbi:hypothetical protein MJC1_03925 [Methylocystis sp. MJC1]|nr:hypothetical protein MJC1_03925 [Methylocystis sp. MJC1]